MSRFFFLVAYFGLLVAATIGTSTDNVLRSTHLLFVCLIFLAVLVGVGTLWILEQK